MDATLDLATPDLEPATAPGFPDGVARFEGGLMSAIELFWTEEDALVHARRSA